MQNVFPMLLSLYMVKYIAGHSNAATTTTNMEKLQLAETQLYTSEAIPIRSPILENATFAI